MKKKILSAVLACAATMALSVSAFAAETATPGDTGTTTQPGDTETSSTPADPSEETSTTELVEKTVTVEVGEVGSDGKALEAKDLFTGDAEGADWENVEEITFTSEDGKFALIFSVEKGAVDGKEDAVEFTKGVDNYKAIDEKALNTTQTLTKEDAGHVAKSDAKKVTLQTKDGETATVTATVKVKVPAEEKAPNTGIALAIAPAALAVSFVTVAAVMSKKKKG